MKAERSPGCGLRWALQQTSLYFRGYTVLNRSKHRLKIWRGEAGQGRGHSMKVEEMDRRTFCLSAAAALAAGRTKTFAAVAPPLPANGPLITLSEIEAIDRDRILHAANEYLTAPPITITASSSPRSKGGKHDYFSEADYFWPDPKNPNGPYINRDGYSNPQNFNDHRLALIRLSLIEQY